MHWLDWVILCIPLALVLAVGLYSKRFVKGVADFLSAGRVAGRYVVCVASGEAGMGLITLVAMYEAMYQSGFGYSFWQQIVLPITMVMGLTGYCTYRFRETRAMTMGQFLEIRYSRKYRIFAACLQSISGIINYGLFPAVGARFLIHFADLPWQVHILGIAFPTFALAMAFFLGLAVLIACLGGQITIMVTDCLQGLLNYPMYALIVLYILFRFSWFQDMAPTLLDRPAGKSMLNPFDIYLLRDFNLFFVSVGIITAVLNRMTWSGSQGYNCAARSAHEQKMGGILGTWRAGFSMIMITLLGITAYTFLNNARFSEGESGANASRAALAGKAFDDVASSRQYTDLRESYRQYLQTGVATPALQEILAASRGEPGLPDGPDVEMQVGRDVLRTINPKDAQTFSTIYGQMRVPVAIRHILPVGLLGLFCAVCIFLMISTDTTYLHSWGSILVQDLIVPLRGGKALKPETQLRLLRLTIASVAVFAFFFSLFFAQVDYILMFFSITGAIWTGGAGIVIVGGLYWKRGTTPGAFVAQTVGSSIAVTGLLLQQFWVSRIYPALERRELVEAADRIFSTLSSPFEPYIMWRVTPVQFPINSIEMLFIAVVCSISLYAIVSLLTCREPFNMDRMLHRGVYRREGPPVEHRIKGLRDFLRKVIGINEEYTRGDRIIAVSVFLWSFVWNFGFVFLGVLIWNMFYRWPSHWWANWFFIERFALGGVVAIVTTAWFTWGGTRDLLRLFRDLKLKEVNELDDGRVIGHVSADDLALLPNLQGEDEKRASTKNIE
jgi:solute:Na+ symporter, SSS family